MTGLYKLKAIDFFCGAGGMTYGLTQAGIDVIAGIDNDPSCRETYEINNPNTKFILSDIRELSPEKLEEITGIKPNDDNLVFVGCSPCQHWTQIHTDKTKSQETKHLLEEFKRFIKHFSPGFIIIENVKGILSHKKESKLTAFLDYLYKNKYTISYGVVNTIYYGVPQHRKRFLLLASRVNRNIKIPEPQQTILTVKDFIGVVNGFDKISAGHKDKTDFIHSTANLSLVNIKRLETTPFNGGNRLSWKDNPELQINAYKEKDDTFRDTYGRMCWNEPAPTLTTKFHSISNGRFAHPEENRGLSLREGATLQTFPKTYVFKGSGTGVIARQIGNAVPPEIAKRIGISILEGFSSK